ncbi:hypothetical protein GGI07_001348 [Coemansia sp. Benny D115]|nr:hypothetical protein GGI07_001348 [Coemansia sp. Benny D115]
MPYSRTTQQPQQQRGMPAASGQQLLNARSRTAAREQLRQRQQNAPASSVIADLGSLHSQQSKDIHSVFVSTPLDSLAGSAYASGHLTPSDQWVSVGNESSGVISLTSSDNEDEDTHPDVPTQAQSDDIRGKLPEPNYADEPSPSYMSADSQYRGQNQWHSQSQSQPQPQHQHQYQQQHSHSHSHPQHGSRPPYASYHNPSTTNPSTSRRLSALHQSSADDEQAVHLLRESVASLLSSSGGSAVSSVTSANPSIAASNSRQRPRGPMNLTSRSAASSQHGRQQPQTLAYERQARSPSALSKVSEPCYPPSAPRRKLTANFDHFSDIALSSSATPPFPPLQRANTRPAATATQFPPTYEEYRQQRHQQHPPVSSTDHVAGGSHLTRTRAGTTDTFDSFMMDATVPGDASLQQQRYAPHPILAEVGGQTLAMDASSSSAATRSPFASIRTVTPIIVRASGRSDTHADFIHNSNHNGNCNDGDGDDDGDDVCRAAHVEAALEQTIHCPPNKLKDSAQYTKR